MTFIPVDLITWERKEYYHHFTKNVMCNYALTIPIDITALQGERLYPAMLWLLTQTVNEIKEFRTSLSEGAVGYFETMHPSYTIFNSKSKNFVVIWTTFQQDYPAFLESYQKDVEAFQNATVLAPKPDKPRNTFDVSMIPWISFSSFQINVYNGSSYLLPIFTMGKTYVEKDKTFLPLSLQIHHAACDGYHASLFVNTLQNKIDAWPWKCKK